MRRATVWTVTLLLVGGLACGGMGGGGGSGGTGTLTSQQLRELETQYGNMYDLVRSERPTWMQTRGNVSFQDPEAALPAVFVDGVEQGRLSALRGLNPSDVEEAEYMSARDATTRYGTGYPGGVIRVVTRRG